MEAFKALSFAEKWQVRRCLLRGEAPVDPRMAAAAIELAEHYQRRSKTNTKQARWLRVAFGDLALNPAMRPKRVARSLEASRRLAGEAG